MRIPLFIFSLLLTTASLLAQPESESPYSSSESYEPVNNPEWYETPFLWIGIVMFVIAAIYLLAKGRRGVRS